MEDELQETQTMKPFTKSDKEAMQQSQEKFCSTCAYISDCTTFEDQSVKAQFRDGVEDISELWGCTIHRTEDELLSEMEAGQV